MALLYIRPIIHTSSFARGQLAFGDLQALGYLTKEYISTGEPDYHDIEWRVVGHIEFDDSNGNHWQQGDVITWSK